MISRKFVVLIYVFAAAGYVSSSCSYSHSSEHTCVRRSNTFLYDLKLQCPLTISVSFPPPVEMDGESFDRALSSGPENIVTAVLIYASWCPFSSGLRQKFLDLSSLFPQIKHVMVEQSSATPSLFSRYGIHSIPALLIVNQTGRVRHHGFKDLESLVQFYKKTTGFHPVADITEVQISHLENAQRVPQSVRTSLEDLYTSEPYLLLSVAFVMLKVFLYFFPAMVTRVKALWIAHVPRLNLSIFGDSRQLLGRALHFVDIKRVSGKLKLCQLRNFHKGARNARVWASSLASVSLGETSSARVPQTGDL